METSSFFVFLSSLSSPWHLRSLVAPGQEAFGIKSFRADCKSLTPAPHQPLSHLCCRHGLEPGPGSLVFCDVRRLRPVVWGGAHPFCRINSSLFFLLPPSVAGTSPQEVKVETVSVSKCQQCAVVFYKTQTTRINIYRQVACGHKLWSF